MSSYGSNYHRYRCCSDYDGDLGWWFYYTILGILAIGCLAILYFGITNTIKDKKLMATMSEEQKCLHLYINSSVNNIPVKCIKYFK